jgi:integrase
MHAQGWLFPGQQTTKPISTRQLHRIVVEAAQAAEITKRVGPHTLRHYVSFLTMSGNSVNSADLAVNYGVQRIETWLATRHSFPDATGCRES